MIFRLFPYFITAIISITITMTLTDRFYQPSTIVTVDIVDITARFSDYISSKGMTGEQVADKGKLFSKILENSLDTYSKNNNVTILVKQAVASGSHEDITGIISNNVGRSLNEKSY